jgi:hypothetical protein
MVDQRSGSSWKAMRNPFYSIADSPDGALLRYSGRSADIREIITGGTGAIILASAPMMGKTSLLRYLHCVPGVWSWRKEVEDLSDVIDLDSVHFLPVDLKPLEDIVNIEELLACFIQQCIQALQLVWKTKEVYTGHRGLRTLLRDMTHQNPTTRYYLTFDSLDRLQRPGMPVPEFTKKEKSPQERSLAILNHSGALHLLVDLLDEFNQFGVILSLESFPLPKISDQFSMISSDLARFRTLLLQTFTRADTIGFLQQRPISLDPEWGHLFREMGAIPVFSETEQAWLYEQAGTHPYLLQQCCFHAFELKQQRAARFDQWLELEPPDRDQLIELMNERVSTFLDRTWKRVNEALEKCSSEATEHFRELILEHHQKRTSDEIAPFVWNQLGRELHFILRNEGIVRYDPLTAIYYPGALFMTALVQRLQTWDDGDDEQPEELSDELKEAPLLIAPGQKTLEIRIPGEGPVVVPLSELEYRLLRALLQHPKKCSEVELMQAAWGRKIDRSVFTQRMHHLRKKIRKYTGDENLIENRYGGIYLLNHAEWIRL